MAKTATKKMEAVDKTSTESTTRFPLWKDQMHRVQGAMWMHDQEDGKTRYTVSISRSYLDADKEWRSVHFYDEKDLDDVIDMATAAKEEILRRKNLAIEVGED